MMEHMSQDLPELVDVWLLLRWIMAINCPEANQSGHGGGHVDLIAHAVITSLLIQNYINLIFR